MLASTVQFSSYAPTPATHPPPQPTGHTHNRRLRPAWPPEQNRPPTPHHPQQGQQRPTPHEATDVRMGPVPSGPNSMHKLLDVPPMSNHPANIRRRQWPPHPHPPKAGTGAGELLRKEVIQPHLPVRLPCYDFVPIASPTFDGSLPQGVRPPASGVTNFRDVTGGVYKARERIHRSVADLRLLATPTSWGRVADPNPN